MQSETYRDVVWRKYRPSTGVFGKWAATLGLKKRASRSNINLLSFSSQMGYPQELQVSGVPLTLVAHLTKLAFKLSNSFAHLKWTATLEGRALSSHTFLSYWQLGKWANVVRESRTFALEFVKGQRRWILKRNKAILRNVS